MLLICPGVHSPELTKASLQGLNLTQDYWVVPPACSPYDAVAIWRALKMSPKRGSSLSFLSFSAGVVGALGVARYWQFLGGQVEGFIAVDGWGVPLWESFSVCRISHDVFTHWSSALLGGGQLGFYADPPVAHLEIWRSPHTTKGWQLEQPGLGLQTRTYTTATRVICQYLNQGCKSAIAR
jgi:hypothetical protein